MNELNVWEYDIDEKSIKKQKDYNLETLYEHTHSELSLQQNKRDQIITIYLALFSFIIPFALSLEGVGLWMKGLIFMAVGVIGVLFSHINVRYRVYKEAYWLACQAITVLMNVKEEELSKKNIQRAFYYSLKKKGDGYCTDGKWSVKKFVKKNLYSAETLHQMIQVFITATISCLGAALVAYELLSLRVVFAALVGGGVFVATFAWLMSSYFKKFMEVYAVMREASADAKRRDELFNATFSKAWLLHVYYKENKE